jgi:xanthine dehydrogenase accessory factor
MLIRDDGSRLGTVGGGEMESRVVDVAGEAMADGRPRLLTYRLVDPSTGDPGVCGGEMDVYVEPYMNIASLLIIGAGHVGRAVCELAQWTGWDVHLWDDRPEQLEELDDAVTPHGGELSEVLADIPLDARSAIVMVTRNVPLDVELIPAVVKQPAAYIGLMGSARRWSTTKKLLIDAGCSEDEISRISTPIGLEIGAETPEQIAISIMAEVVRATSTR